MKIISERCLLDQTKGKMHQMFPLYNRQNLTTIKEGFLPIPQLKMAKTFGCVGVGMDDKKGSKRRRRRG